MAGKRFSKAPPTTRIVAVGSGKGGTGKTFLTSALGYSLAKRHARRVTLLDLDFQGSLTRFLGAKASAAVFDESPVQVHGMTLFRGGLALKDAEDGEIIAHISRAAAMGDTLLVDMRPDLLDVAHRVCFERPDVFWVVVPRLLLESVSEAQKLIGLVTAHGQRYVIVGNEHYRARAVTRAQALLANGYREHLLDKAIPRQSVVPEAAGEREPLTLFAPKSAAAAAVDRLADTLVAEGGA